MIQNHNDELTRLTTTACAEQAADYDKIHVRTDRQAMIQCEWCSRGHAVTNRDQRCPHAVAKYINYRGPHFTPPNVCLRGRGAGWAAKGWRSPPAATSWRGRFGTRSARRPTCGDCDDE